ncbi:hypothetical protein BDN72DRAFT_840322 [Pluteus cervinus]|uniref:Uncharacterized protein n=1 Tax=Pluteus cervinus TaxID=181527 RepID=A0ACD3AV91_9AGAR|nr:hypothetical protein BDN72DRAFT_840322 [Pluteus cervinus]
MTITSMVISILQLMTFSSRTSIEPGLALPSPLLGLLDTLRIRYNVNGVFLWGTKCMGVCHFNTFSSIWQRRLLVVALGQYYDDPFNPHYECPDRPLLTIIGINYKRTVKT